MERLYLILNREGIPLAQAVLESPPGAEVVQMRLLQEDDNTDYIKVGEVQLIGLDNSMTSKRGVVTMQRGPRLVIRPGEVLGAQARENLRIQTDFESVMYPVSGFWKGQRPIQGHDLSCGGLAFYSERPALKAGEVVEVVLPVTDEPLLLHLRVLRELNSDREGLLLYASRFIDICLDEEVSIRKAVFSIQLNAPRSANDV